MGDDSHQYFTDLDPGDLPEDVYRQLVAVLDGYAEGGPLPIPADSPLGRYLVERGHPTDQERDS